MSVDRRALMQRIIRLVMRHWAFAIVAFPFLTGAALAAPPDSALDARVCSAASAAVQRAARLPPRLLDAIGIVETGRIDPVRRVVAPWPWSINANGEGHFYNSKAEAIEAVRQLLAAGVDSVDVGCMQINLRDHPDAFASLNEAFDPAINTAYAGRFLWQLFDLTGNWPKATAAYHSQTPEIGGPYAARVMAAWPDAARYGGTAAPAVDPDGVMTPAFRARLQADAAFRAARDARMRGQVAPPASLALMRARSLAALQRVAAAHPAGWLDAAR